MMYEVFIPSSDADGFDVTMTVEADNWMTALKSGLERTGEGADAIRNVMCDIQEDNTIHVTDATTRRVFILTEVPTQADAAPAEDGTAGPEDETERVNLDAVAPPPQTNTTPEPAAQAPSPEPEPPAPAEPVVLSQPKADSVSEHVAAVQAAQQAAGLESESGAFTTSDGRTLHIGSSTYEALQKDQEPARIVREDRSPTGQRRALGSIGRSSERVSENILEEVFLEIQEIHERQMTMDQVVNFVMDLALSKVGAEAGSVMFADINGSELYFATARGPEAEKVMNFRIPMGVGIAGFCAREGVSLAISDAKKDDRFYPKVSETIGYPTRSICCAPIQFEGRVYGAIELMNKEEDVFTSTEVNALTYIGRQLAQYVHDLIMDREKLD